MEFDAKKIEKEISALYLSRLNCQIEEEEYIIKYKELIQKRSYIMEEKNKIKKQIEKNKSDISLKNELRKIKRKIDKIKNESFSSEDIIFFINDIKLDGKNIIIKYKFSEE